MRVLLKNIYLQHASAMRPEVEANAILPLGFGFALLGFFAFAYLYARSYQGGGVAEGIQFGVLAGVILCCFGTIWDYMVWPVSPTLGCALDGRLPARVRALWSDRGSALSAPSSAIPSADGCLRLGARGEGGACRSRSVEREGGT